MKIFPIIFCTDFDGTVTYEDTNVLMMPRFGNYTAQLVLYQCLKKDMPTHDGHHAMLKTFVAPPEKIDNFIASIPIDPTFKEFVKWLNETGIPIYVISDGFKRSIENVFETNGIKGIEKIYSNNMVIKTDNGQTKYDVESPYSSATCNEPGKCGTCKTETVQKIKKETGAQIVGYAGDGSSDFCVIESDVVDLPFATKGLVQRCEANGIKATPFNYFSEIKEVLQAEVDKFMADPVKVYEKQLEEQLADIYDKAVYLSGVYDKVDLTGKHMKVKDVRTKIEKSVLKDVSKFLAEKAQKRLESIDGRSICFALKTAMGDAALSLSKEPGMADDLITKIISKQGGQMLVDHRDEFQKELKNINDTLICLHAAKEKPQSLKEFITTASAIEHKLEERDNNHIWSRVHVNVR
jgi:2,3-diketo-5-methylthio-1-phosphopentane phosphatase